MRIEMTVDELHELASRVVFLGATMSEAEKATADVLRKIKEKEDMKYASETGNSIRVD